MGKIRLVWVITVAVLLVATPVWASSDDRPPIYIINERNDTWEVAVWAYDGYANAPVLYSCQTLRRSSEYLRTIDPVKASGLSELFKDHCGNYGGVRLYFRVYNKETGESHNYDTFGIRNWTTWGATWTWDGKRWRCSGIGCP
mgnify:CR=1 FL=1